MKKIVTLALTLSTLGASVASAQAVRVGMAYDAGGKADKSFNQSAYEGSQLAAKKLGVQVKDFEPSDPSQIIQGVRSFAKEGFDLTVGVGFANNASITQVAKENPDLYFGLVDDVSTGKNVASLVFNEEQGSYLVGYLAAMNSSTGVVGFIGGMNIPPDPQVRGRLQGGRQGRQSQSRRHLAVCGQHPPKPGTTPARRRKSPPA